MKIRTGFVSNSSSSSFVLDMTKLTEEQIEKIKNHVTCAYENYRAYFLDIFPENMNKEEIDQKIRDWYYWWDVRIIGNSAMVLKTSMNNFSMRRFLEVIGIDRLAIVNEDYD